MRSNKPIINVYEKNNIKSEVVTQLLYGDTFKKIKVNGSWFKIKNAVISNLPVLNVYYWVIDSHFNLNLFRINHRRIKEGITITVVITKNIPQSPFNQSTNSPEEAANVVRPRVPIEASNAY